MAKPKIDDFKQVLFVEGDSDLQFYKAILKQRFSLEVFIQNSHGRDQTKSEPSKPVSSPATGGSVGNERRS
jgi:hypothetical protein